MLGLVIFIPRVGCSVIKMAALMTRGVRISNKYIASKLINFRMLCSSGNGMSEKLGLVLGVYTCDNTKTLQLSNAAMKFNEAINGDLLEHIKLAGPAMEKGKGQVFYKLSPEYPVIAVMNLGNPEAAYNEQEEIHENRENVRIAASMGCKKLQEVGVTKVFLDGMGDPEAAGEGATLGVWLYQAFKNKEKQKKAPQLELIGSEEEKFAWQKGVVKAQAQNVARNLMDTPANLMTPTIFAQNAVDLLSPHGVKVTIHDEKWAVSKKMGSFLSVSRGSAEPAVFLELCYGGASNQEKPVCFVGKGITFDSGGISLKPGRKMDEMRADMGGGACVVATFYAAAVLKLNVNMIGLIPLSENLPSGSATKPGDVVFAMNGKSILVDNTDAEGRLVLADALCYAQEFNPKLIVDIATLTGAIKTALGGAATGVFTNSTALYEMLQEAGSLAGDRVWRMPLWQYYSKQVTESSSSDLVNLSRGADSGFGGSCTAAAFLKEFVPKGNWMHLDIAGVMGPQSLPYLTKGMTGRPTRTLIEFISRFYKTI